MTSHDSGRLLAGAGRADITPKGNCILDGFAARDHRGEGVHDPLSVTALAVSRYGKRAVILGLDLLELTDAQVDDIWRLSRERYGLEPDELFINCSHTHAGPLVRERFNRNVCPTGQWCRPEQGYLHHLLDSILDAIGDALDSMEPAKASWAIGETHIGICRRAHDTGIYKGPAAGYIGIYANIPNPHKTIDRTCPVISLTKEDGGTICVLFGAPCHPTTMSHPNYLVSAEYPGAARRIIEERFDGAPSLFIQGIGGDVKPRIVAEETGFRSGTYEDVEAVGAELADDVARTMSQGMKPLDISIRTSLKRIPLPFAEGWNEDTFRTYAQEGQSEFRRAWAGYWLDKLARGETPPESMDLALSIMELAPGLRFLGIAGELLTDMGLKIKRGFTDGVTLPCGYTNGRIGYIPDSNVLREGGYEATETVFFTMGMPAPWREDIDDTLLGAFGELEKNLH